MSTLTMLIYFQGGTYEHLEPQPQALATDVELYKYLQSYIILVNDLLSLRNLDLSGGRI